MPRVTQAPNDKEQVVPMLSLMKAQSGVLGMPTRLLADTGFCSEKNIAACEDAGVAPLIAVAHALRKQTIEPVFGIIKSVMCFRQFSLRGLDLVSGEWSLVCLAWNLKRMAVLRPKFG